MPAFFTTSTFVPFASLLVFLWTMNLSFFLQVILEANIQTPEEKNVQTESFHCTATQKGVKFTQENILALKLRNVHSVVCGFIK
jgi:energy-converting hydrogenase Eha subunit H